MKTLTLLTLIIICFTITSYSQDSLKTSQAKPKPKAEYKVGPVKVTVWENKIKGKNGDYVVKNFQVEKTYQKDGQWKTTNNYNEQELLQLRAAIDKAISEQNVIIKEEPKEEQK